MIEITSARMSQVYGLVPKLLEHGNFVPTDESGTHEIWKPYNNWSISPRVFKRDVSDISSVLYTKDRIQLENLMRDNADPESVIYFINDLIESYKEKTQGEDIPQSTVTDETEQRMREFLTRKEPKKWTEEEERARAFLGIGEKAANFTPVIDIQSDFTPLIDIRGE